MEYNPGHLYTPGGGQRAEAQNFFLGASSHRGQVFFGERDGGVIFHKGTGTAVCFNVHKQTFCVIHTRTEGGHNTVGGIYINEDPGAPPYLYSGVYYFRNRGAPHGK